MKKTQQKRSNKKHNKTKKKNKILLLKNKTPREIKRISKEISQLIDKGRGPKNIFFMQKPSSYQPTINAELVSLKTATRENIQNCNNETAFLLQEPLKIAVPNGLFGYQCLPYDNPKAQQFLLKNLSANKHVNPSHIITPVQSQSNCWFNTMFTTLFISDKGRRFFHYFRQLMILGEQSNGSSIPTKLKDGLALLNFSIECSLTGNQYAYQLDTNSIIKKIYDSIPKNNSPYIVSPSNPSNPWKYYNSIIQYLNNQSIEVLFIPNIMNSNWKTNIQTEMKSQLKPHIIILEIFDEKGGKPGYSGLVTNKELTIHVNDTEYELDSCIIRDTTQEHFCSTLMCEKTQMAYDGMSFHRLTPMNWKNLLNTNQTWSFEGSTDIDGNALKWSFLHGYQMLFYYRI